MNTIKLSRRSANYSKAELNCLVNYLEENPELVSVKLGGKFQTADDFRIAWEELADRISSLGGYFGVRRTGTEIKRKWSDLKSRVKAKAASLAIEADKAECENPHVRLTPIEERVLAIISKDLEEQSQRIDTAHSSKWPLVKVFSFPHELKSEDRVEEEYDEGEGEETEDNTNESGLMEEMRMNSKQGEKKRRISEAFTSSTSAEKKTLGLKRIRITSEEEQLQALCNSQMEVNAELRMIKEILKKTQQSIDKLTLLKRAELRLKCAKYGVEFEDLFD